MHTVLPMAFSSGAQATIMVVTVTASTTAGKPLVLAELAKVRCAHGRGKL